VADIRAITPNKVITRWLSRVPQGAHTLALVALSLTETTVATWPAQEVHDTPGRVIADAAWTAADDYANGSARLTRFVLRWYAEDGRMLVAFGFTAGDDSAQPFDGSAESQIANMQKHLETVLKLQQAGHTMTMQSSYEIIQLQQQRIHELEAVRDAYEAQRTTKLLEAQLDEPGAASGKPSRLEETLEKLLPMLLAPKSQETPPKSGA